MANMLSIASLVFVFLFQGVFTLTVEVPDLWENYKSQYKKSYGVGEDKVRLAIFESNLESILRHNLEQDLGMQLTHTKGINQFTDLTTKEFSELVTCIHIEKDHVHLPPSNISRVPKVQDEPPEKMDWRDKGAVNSKIRDQGQCGCCYACAGVENVGSAWQLSKQEMLWLSPQEIVDCGKGGCKGGYVPDVFEFTKENGLETEEDYPYEANQVTCRKDDSKAKAKIVSFTEIYEAEKGLQEAVGLKSPAAGYVKVGNEGSWKDYKSGIFLESDCTCTSYIDVNHAIQIIGYGEESGTPFWLIKNSWAETWGEQGYIRIERNKKACCISNYAYYAVA